MTHRGHGEGSIFHRTDGRWVAELMLGYDSQGKRKRWCGSFKTRREASVALAKIIEQHRAGTLPTEDHLTVAQFAERWSAGLDAQGLRPSVVYRYRKNVEHHILPTLGPLRLQKLGPLHLRGLYTTKLETLSPRTVGLIHAIVHTMLRDALRWGLVARNVADLVTPPRVTKAEMQSLSPEQSRALLAGARGDPLEALYVLALTTGMREGELLGLKWADIDWPNGTVIVQRSLSRVPGAGFVEQPPKSARGRRNVPLIPIAADALKRHRVRQAEAQLRAGARWMGLDLVFCGAVGQPLYSSDVVARLYRPLLARLDLPPIRFHDMRHSTASLLLSLGIHPKVVQEYLGHSQISMTMDTYSHTLPSMLTDAAQKLSDLLSEGK